VRLGKSWLRRDQAGRRPREAVGAAGRRTDSAGSISTHRRGQGRGLSSFTGGQFTSSGGVTGVAAFPFLSSVASTFGLPGYRFECAVVDNAKPAQVGGGGTLSIASTR
jgi:hypothetical protein